MTFSNPFPSERASLGGVTNSNGYDTDAPTGYLQSYNLTVERDLGRGAVLEIGFVGSKGTHFLRRYDINQPLRSLEAYLAGISALRPYQGLNTINYVSFGGNSIYNAGQVTLRKHGRGGTFYRLNYAYSKSIDDASQFGGSVPPGFRGRAGLARPEGRARPLGLGPGPQRHGRLVVAGAGWTRPAISPLGPRF